MGLALVIAVAALLRYPALDAVPPGLNFDEGGEGVAAMDVWNGIYRVWWPIGGGKEPLMAYAVQPFLWVFGFTRVALRAYTATLGVIAAAGTWWLARELLAGPADLDPGPSWLTSVYGWLIPLAAGLGLATAFWHVAYSRIAFRALAMPAVEALAVAWLWRALRGSQTIEGRDGPWRHFAGAGALIGLGAYTYLAGRFVPVALALFFAVEGVLTWRRSERPMLVRHFKGLILAGVAALLVFSPLLVFFSRHLSAFLERAGAVSIFNPAWNQGDFWGTLLRTMSTTAGTFAGLTGDPNPLANLPGRPMLGPVLAPLFWLGLAISIWRVVQGATRKQNTAGDRLGVSPYLFLLCWWPVMLLPGILAPEDPPHHLRIIGTAPATYILVAIGLAGVIAALKSLISNLKISNLLTPARMVYVPLVLYLPIGLVTARDYFVRWRELPELYMAYDVYAVELAGQMAGDMDPSAVYVIPMDQRAGHEARHYTLDFLYQGQVPYSYVPVDETTIGARLTSAVAGHNTLRIVRWLQDKHMAADEREVLAFLLWSVGAHPAGNKGYPVYQVETWALPSAQTVFALPEIERSIGATFGGVLRLEAAEILARDNTVGVALRWAPLAAMDVDYKASVRLVAADGEIAAQKDRVLRHNWHQGTSLWPAETVNEYYVLPPVPPGEYEVQAVVYWPETLAPLTVDGRPGASLGTALVIK
jgi:hypothetical protein